MQSEQLGADKIGPSVVDGFGEAEIGCFCNAPLGVEQIISKALE